MALTITKRNIKIDLLTQSTNVNKFHTVNEIILIYVNITYINIHIKCIYVYLKFVIGYCPIHKLNEYLHFC